MPTQTQEDEYDEAREGGRLGTPTVDTAVPFTNAFSVKDMLFMTPSILAAGGSGLLLFVVGASMWVLIASFVVCALTTMLGCGLVLSSHEYTDPREVAAGWIVYFSTWVLTPVSDPFSANLRLHGVKRGFADGSIEMADGTLVGIRGLTGRTTQNLSQEQFDRIGARFGTNIDEGITDFGFKIVSQTKPHDIEELVEEWEDLGYSGVLDQMRGYMGEYMRAKVEWLREVDGPAQNAHEMEHFVTVRVRPEDISGYDPMSEADDRGIEDKLWSVVLAPFRAMNPLSGYGKFWETGSGWVGSSDSDEPPLWVKKEVQNELRRRLTVIDRQFLAGIDGCSVERLSIEEHAAVLLSYWTGKQHVPDEDLQRRWNQEGDIDMPCVWPPARLYNAGEREYGVEDPENVPGSEAAQQTLRTAVPSADREEEMAGSDLDLMPDHFEPKPGYLEIGDQYAAGYWICDHQTAVSAGFAKGLYQLQDVDYTLTWDVTPVEKKQAIEEVEQTELNTGAKASNQAEIKSRSTISKKKVLADIKDTLENSSAQAWDISGYVMLRVGPRQALEYAGREENEHRDFESLEEMKMEALLDAETQLESAVKGSPFQGMLVKPRRWQKEILASASPNKGNVYNETLRPGGEKGKIERHLEVILGDEETSGPKQRRVLGGWLGALFPPCTATIDEEGGMYWGRDTETNLPFRTNPADRNTGGHMMTAGITRSGKTYASEAASADWFIEGMLPQIQQYMDDKPERQFVACDTQRGFLAPCYLMGGKHIPVDGDTNLNPFDARPSVNPQETDDPYRLASDFVTEFIKRILRSQDTDPSRFHTVIELGVETNYQRAGMASGEFVPDDEMPTMDGALDIWREMQNEPENFSHSVGDSEESRTTARLAGELLSNLSGFREGGKYENLLGQTTFTFDTDETEAPFFYLDLSGLTTSKDAEKSAMLWLGQHFTTQLSRSSNKEMVFLGDEAHLMLYSDEQVELILRWLREWARNNSWVWLISQNLSEYMVDNSGESSGKKEAMMDQFAFKQIFNMPMEDDKMLREFLPNDHLSTVIQSELTPGLAEEGYTEFVAKVEDNDDPGWHRVRVETCPLMDHALNYDPKSTVSFDEYMQFFLHTDALAPNERLFATDEELEQEPEIMDRRGMADLYAQQHRSELSESTDPLDGPDSGTVRDDQGRFAEQTQEADD